MGQEEKPDEVEEMRAEIAKLADESEGGDDAAADPSMKYAVVSRLVATERRRVRWMYREEPVDLADTGWRFFSGDEPEDFAGDPENFEFHAPDVVVEIDPSVAPYLDREAPVAFERESGDAEFTEVVDFAPPAPPG